MRFVYYFNTQRALILCHDLGESPLGFAFTIYFEQNLILSSKYTFQSLKLLDDMGS